MNTKVLRIVFISLFAAIICAACFIKIPLGPVPIVIQNGLSILTAVILGGYIARFPTLIFLAAGLIGLPVFAGGSVGFAAFAGPTGGFLYGYYFGAIIAGFIAGTPSVGKKKFNVVEIVRVSLAMLAGMIVLYIPGIMHFANWAAMNSKMAEGQSAFSYTMAKCVTPFIPGDLLKVAVGIAIALVVRPVLAQYLYSDLKNEENNSEKCD